MFTAIILADKCQTCASCNRGSADWRPTAKMMGDTVRGIEIVSYLLIILVERLSWVINERC